jgi:hypothetical protein
MLSSSRRTFRFEHTNTTLLLSVLVFTRNLQAAHIKTLLLWRARVLQNPRFLTSYPASAEAQELQCDAPHGAGQSPTLATLTSAPVGLLMLVLAGILGLCGAWRRIWATPSHAYQMLP